MDYVSHFYYSYPVGLGFRHIKASKRKRYRIAILYRTTSSRREYGF